MELRSSKSTSLGAEKPSRDAADAVRDSPTQPAIAAITPHSTSDQFRVWKIRFNAFIKTHKPALAPGTKPGDAAILSDELNAEFAAILVSWLDYDFLLELSRVVDVEQDGITMFRHVCTHFTDTTSSEPSPEERVYNAIRHTHRATHDTLAHFLQAINRVSAEYASATRDRAAKHTAVSTIDKLLALHVIHELNKAAWLNAHVAATKKLFRTQPATQFSIATFNKEVMDLCPTPDRPRASRHSPTPADADEPSSKYTTSARYEPRHRDHRDRDRDRDRGSRNITPHISALTAEDDDQLIEDDDQWPPPGCTSDPLFPDVINIDA